MRVSSGRACLMAKQFIIIDGYNLLFQTGLAKNLGGPGNLSRARSAMMGQLSMWLPAEQHPYTTLVFDARAGSDRETGNRETNAQFVVKYAAGFDNADEMIEVLLQHHSAPKQVLVVSSDHRVQTAARRRRAQFADAGPWWDALRHTFNTPARPDPVPSDPRESMAMSDEEREQWKKKFGS
ncbi:MAG TPA: NYN domain-containing protein [Pirellulaceae bacterium]|nr:NYN domain-containing protein [Pirellulaceae bacterium]